MWNVISKEYADRYLLKNFIIRFSTVYIKDSINVSRLVSYSINSFLYENLDMFSMNFLSYSMFMKIEAFVLLFLIWLRFPQLKSLSQIIRSRNDYSIIKRLWKYEKVDYRLGKAELDLEFFVRCRDNNVTPRFLNFRLANRSLRSSFS